VPPHTRGRGTLSLYLTLSNRVVLDRLIELTLLRINDPNSVAMQ